MHLFKGPLFNNFPNMVALIQEVAYLRIYGTVNRLEILSFISISKLLSWESGLLLQY